MYYGIDLRVAVDRETPRRLWALLQGLPPDAPVWRNQPASWTTTNELLATLVEVSSQGQVKVPRPGSHVPAQSSGHSGGARVVSIAEFVQQKSNHMKGGGK